MNSFGKILVHLDDSHKCLARLNLALLVAKVCANSRALPSVLDAVYAVTPSHLSSSMAYLEYSAITYSILLEADEERVRLAKVQFDEWEKTLGNKASWQSEIKEVPGFSLLRHALMADLLVLGQHNPSDPSMQTVPKKLAEDLIIESGKPALLLPFIGSMRSTLQNVMLAWKPTRESSRALSASLPFLQNAQSIHIFADIENLDDNAFKQGFEAYLQANAVSVKPTFQSSFGVKTDGEALLSNAMNVGADLLVMGCYGHSRTREFILGGASRTILGSMTLPVLMSH